MRGNSRAGARASLPVCAALGAPVLDPKALGMDGELDRLVAVDTKTLGLGVQGDGLHRPGVDTHSPASAEEVLVSLPLPLGVRLRVSQAEGSPR